MGIDPLLKQRELVRKSLHISVCTIILFDIFSHDLAIFLTISVTLLYTLFEVLRLNKVEITYYRKLVEICARSDKSTSFAFDPLLLAIPILLVIIFFRPMISYPTVLIITISDGLSTLVGIIFGRTKLLGNKTLEGSIVFFFSAILILSFFVNVLYAAFIAFLLTIVELVSKNYDNLTIPLFSVFIMNLL